LHMIEASRRFMSASSPVPAANFVAVSLWQPLGLQQIQTVIQKYLAIQEISLFVECKSKISRNVVVCCLWHGKEQ
jgi:hypothetical protein